MTARADGPAGRRHGRVLAVGLLVAVVAVVALAAPALGGSAPVTASCSVGETYPEPGESVTISAFDSQDADSFRFDTDGDGAPETDRRTDPFYTTTYSNGTYQPVVTAFNSTEETSDTATCPTLVVAPNTPPSPRLDFAPDRPVVGEQVSFDASATTDDDGEVFFLSWDFGADGTIERSSSVETGIDYTATRTYNTTGTKLVRIVAEDDDGDTASVTVEIPVGSANEPPTARFDYSPDPVVAGETTTFDASASSDPDGQVVTYAWDFDGDRTVDRRTTDPVTNYTFPASAANAGFVNVVLTVTDGTGANDTTTRDVRVVGEGPVARCSVEPTTVAPGEELTADATAASNADQYQFDTGSGEFGEFTEDPTRTTTYDEPGTYTVRVKAWESATERSDVETCGEVTVEEPNEPPNPAFTVQPRPAVTGETTTFDASASSDPDGQVVRYEWDFDGDGTVDDVTGSPTTTTRYAQANSYVVELTVVDDDGASASTSRDLAVERRPEPVPRCRVSERTVAPGETVTVDASRSENADQYQFDTGSGEFGDFTEEPTTEVSYEEPGTYTPVVRVWALPSEQSATFECPPVTVEDPNEPPTARFGVSNGTVVPGAARRFDASNSTDPDGRVVEYRWDFDGDGTRDAVTNNPVVSHTYPTAEHVSVHLVVVDDDGATDETLRRLSPPEGGVATEPPPGTDAPPDDSDEGLLPIPVWWLLPVAGLAGTGGGLALCRWLRRPRGGSAPATTGGITAVGAGTFETPRGGGTVTIDDVGFEPDVLVFAATNNVRSGDADTTHRTDGWSYGVATARLGSGDGARGGFDQEVVAVANDTQRSDAAVGSAATGQVLDVVVHDDHEASGVAGEVTAATPTGFQFAVDTSALPPGETAGRYQVAYQAFETAPDADVEVGHFLTPAEAGTQTVELSGHANYVRLVGSSAVTDANSTSVGGGSVGLCHGHAAGVDAPDQTAVHSTIDPADPLANAYGAYEDRALHLVDLADRRVTGTTSARVTGLGDSIDLAFDEVSATGATGDPRRLVTYLAVDAGDQAPGLGSFAVPGPAEDSEVSVDCGVAPAGVEVTGCNVTTTGVDQVATGNSLSFGWSHGTAVRTVDGVYQQVLQSAIGSDLATTYADLFDAVEGGAPTGSGTRSRGPGTGAFDGGSGRPDGGRGSSDGRPTARDGSHGVSGSGGVPGGAADAAELRVPDAVAVLATLNAEGHVAGWEALSVTALSSVGFDATRTVVTDVETPSGVDRPRLLYTAWPVSDDV